jgi:predicted esterase
VRFDRLLGTGAAVAAVFLAAGGPGRAQIAHDSVRGRVVERIVSHSDRARSYALFVPSSYDTTRAWPIAFVMDPRGRALLPLARMQAAAERYGWIVMSSYDTRSDDPNARNDEAVNAMLDDAQVSFRLDTRRFYLVGFSGTARQAWEFAALLGEPVAGILGAGADLHRENQWLLSDAAPHPAFFGTAGFTDFNYDEIRQLEPWLDRGQYAWRTRYFNGTHEWPPEHLFAEAMAWFELQAMRTGKLAVRESFVDSLYALTRDSAALQEETDAAAAHDRYREMLRDFRGLRDSTFAYQKVASLGGREAVKKLAERRRNLSREEGRYNQILFQFIVDVRNSNRPPSIESAVSRLEIEKLQRSASRSADPEAAFTAQRLLELAFVNTSFYAPRDLLTAKLHAQALLMLDVADRIHPGRAGTALGRARVLAQLGRIDEGLDELERAVNAGVRAPAFVADSLLAPLRASPRFPPILSKARQPLNSTDTSRSSARPSTLSAATSRVRGPQLLRWAMTSRWSFSPGLAINVRTPSISRQ